MQGLRLRRVLRILAWAHPQILPSALMNDVGTLVAIISQLNTRPACAPVNASMAALRLAMHDSGSGWFATPFPNDSFIHYSTPVYPGALIRLLQAESVRVRRPESIVLTRRIRTRLWSSKGFCLACPRDIYWVVGDEIIETPTCWRSRQFEGDAYRNLFKEYFHGGARWTAAPRPQLPDELFDEGYRVPEPANRSAT